MGSAGSAGYICGLSGLGHTVAARLAEQPGSRGRVVWETRPAYQDHLLAIGELYVGLVEQQHRGGAELLIFQTEADAWRWFAGPFGERLPVKSDAYVEQPVSAAAAARSSSRPSAARRHLNRACSPTPYFVGGLRSVP